MSAAVRKAVLSYTDGTVALYDISHTRKTGDYRYDNRAMIMGKEWFAALAIGCAIIGHAPYLYATYRGKIHPHPYSWLIWTLVTVVIAAGQWAKGGGVGTLPTMATALFGCAIFIMSLRYGFAHVHRVDHLFLAAAVLSIVPWLYMRDPTLSVIMMTCIDTLGFLPTLRKAWMKPHTEHPVLFAMNVPRHVFELAALESYNIATVLDPVVMLFVNTATVLVIELRRHARRGRNRRMA